MTPARLRHCGNTRYKREVELQTSGASAWWDGVVCCRSRTCPTCFVARRFKLAREISQVVHEREHETCRQSMLATLTVRHSAGDPVTLPREVRKVWRRMVQSRRWQALKRDYGVEWIAAEEITHGPNGWHPHMHVLLMPRVHLDPDDHLNSAFDWHSWWAGLVRKYIGASNEPSREHGCDLQACDSAEYLSKIGLELSDPAMVKGRSPLGLLEHGEIDRYLELQVTRTRARDVTWSRGLKGIREALPKPEPPATLATLQGSEWWLLRQWGWAVPLDIAERSETPEIAQELVKQALAGKSPARG